MIDRIRDPEVQALALLASILRPEYEKRDDPRWAQSPFVWILARPSRQRGKIGEQLVAGWCAMKNLSVAPSRSCEADRVIQGRRVEIKFSSLWQNGNYNFQQIRDQDYEFLICLGIAPFDAHCWVIPKQLAWESTPVQHGGRGGTDTHWLMFPAAEPPQWLLPYGGTLAEALERLRSL